MSDKLISANNISLVRGQRILFKMFSFNLLKGQAIHVVGENGSGKTSLLKLIIGLLSPTEGNIYVLNKPPKKFENTDLRKIMYLGHKTTIKPRLSVIENLKIAVSLFDSIKVNDNKLDNALKAVGLGGYKDHLSGKLSAGQKRKLMLARLWVSIEKNITIKKLWILDEPLTALDSAAINDLEKLINLHLKYGGGIIFTSHQRISIAQKVSKLKLGV